MLFNGIWDIVQSVSSTSIEVYEWSQTNVRMTRLPNSSTLHSLSAKKPSLSFSGCNLAHAVVKADYLDRRNLIMPGIGFLLQACSVIDFGKKNIELKPGAAKSLNDVSLSSMAGRVGQGLAILYGHSLGLRFTAHLSCYVASLPIGSARSAYKNNAMADFLFADNKRTVLIESKGSFALQKNDPSPIKSVLKKALLQQIDPWMHHLKPTPSNGYVIYSCLREGNSDPSAVFVVDPEGNTDESSNLPFSIEQVMRENYGAWLRAMGMSDSADRLQNLSRDNNKGASYYFLITEISGHKFAFLNQPHDPFYPLCWENIMIGIDYSVLMAISSVINSRDKTLQKLLSTLQDTSYPSKDNVSIFPDGTILGMIDSHPSYSVQVSL